MSYGKVRAVSVGERRAWNRMARIVQDAAFEVLGAEDFELANRLAIAVADAARKEGFALTWQVR